MEALHTCDVVGGEIELDKEGEGVEVLDAGDVVGVEVEDLEVGEEGEVAQVAEGDDA